MNESSDVVLMKMQKIMYKLIVLFPKGRNVVINLF